MSKPHAIDGRVPLLYVSHGLNQPFTESLHGILLPSASAII